MNLFYLKAFGKYRNYFSGLLNFMATEKWKQIKLRDFRGEFKISESGRVKRNGRYAKIKGHWIKERFIAHGITKKGYARIVLMKDGHKKSFYIHRLVAFAFIQEIEGKPHINHKDGIKLNNHYSNLEWCTPQENNEHGAKTGLLKRGKNYKPKPYIKKGRPDCIKPVIDLNTGIFWTAAEVALLLNTKRKYVHRTLSEEKKPNTTQYRYA